MKITDNITQGRLRDYCIRRLKFPFDMLTEEMKNRVYGFYGFKIYNLDCEIKDLQEEILTSKRLEQQMDFLKDFHAVVIRARKGMNLIISPKLKKCEFCERGDEGMPGNISCEFYYGQSDKDCEFFIYDSSKSNQG